MEEKWKDIEGYEGRYQISNFGNVKSLRYNGGNHQKNLIPKVNNGGRLWVELYKHGTKKPMLIHRLVAMAFIPNPENLPQVNHKDENPKNNHVWNLEWCTGKYNITYTMNRHPDWFRNDGKHGRSRKGKHSDMPVNQYDMNGNFIKKWTNTREIFVQTGMSDWSIAECCRGKRKSAYGFKWQYAI